MRGRPRWLQWVWGRVRATQPRTLAGLAGRLVLLGVFLWSSRRLR